MRKNYALQAATAAWLLLELLRAGEMTLAEGWCVGELRPNDVVCEGATVARRRARRLVRLRHRLTAARHRRSGHDEACLRLGVSFGTMRRLLRSWCGDDAAAFLLDGVEEGVEQLDVGDWQGMSPSEVLRHVIGRRIEVRAPADHMLPGVPSPIRFREPPRNRRSRGGP